MRIGCNKSNDSHDEFRSRFKSQNACFHSVQGLMSSCVPFKNLDIKIYKSNFTYHFMCVVPGLTL
jgi:hypothetical protein